MSYPVCLCLSMWSILLCMLGEPNDFYLTDLLKLLDQVLATDPASKAKIDMGKFNAC